VFRELNVLTDGVGAIARTPKHRETPVHTQGVFVWFGLGVIHDDTIECAVQRIIDRDTVRFDTNHLGLQLDGVLDQEAAGLRDNFT
jgi:hypothetical protein